MKLSATALSTASGGLTQYMREIRKYPVLSAEEEYVLAKAVADHQDINAAHKLVTSHLKLVVKIALSMRGYGMSLMDLISEGNIGLMHAVKKFNPELGHRLSTYAMWWIKASIQEYVVRSWSMVKIGTTVAQKKLFFNLNKVKEKIRNFHMRSHDSLSNEDVNNIAAQLNVTNQEVKDMDMRLSGNDCSLDNPIYNDEGNSTTMLEYIPENRANQEIALSTYQEASLKKKLFDNAMLTLSEREQAIISARHLQESPETLDALSKKYNISRERIRQIEAKALEKLKNYVKY